MGKNEKQSSNVVLKLSEHKRKRVDEIEDNIDALFKLPLAEFTAARNTLAATLKKGGRSDEAARVKALGKPPISAWAVNQLYWNYRETFDLLLASGEHFHKAQTSGKVADMRVALETRREILSELSEIAASVLRDANHNRSPDTLHRITTTLEGMSVYASRSDGPRPGRLTHDVDPPGFESFGSFVPRMTLVPSAPSGGAPSDKRKQMHSPAPGRTNLATTNSRRKTTTHNDGVRQLEEKRKTKIAEAKVSLQDAKKSLTEARTRAHSLEASQRKADVEAKKAEKHRLEAEEELRRAKAASEDAAQLARSVAAELEDAESAVEDAERIVEEASKELESLFRESSGK
jgi:hypothetical protein